MDLFHDSVQAAGRLYRNWKRRRVNSALVATKIPHRWRSCEAEFCEHALKCLIRKVPPSVQVSLPEPSKYHVVKGNIRVQMTFSGSPELREAKRNREEAGLEEETSDGSDEAWCETWKDICVCLGLEEQAEDAIQY